MLAELLRLFNFNSLPKLSFVTGKCKFGSCAFDRAPDPLRSHGKTCEAMNAARLTELQTECSDEGYSFESWARRYNTPHDVYNKFSPCTGDLILGEAKKVIQYCHCYNFCGKTQTADGDCKVEGLERTLDLDANTKTDYKAVYASSLFNNWFMLSVRISSYGCTREVWRAREKRKSCSWRSFLSTLQTSQLHP